MNLSKRIRTIGDFVSSGEHVADIGADHGLLELYLLSKYDDISILAIENKIGPFKILDNSLRAFSKVKLSFSSGLKAIKPDIDTVVIAGMGGLNIVKILEEFPQKVSQIKKFIIDAHRDIEAVRKSLIKFGFKIDEEKIIYEQDKFYVVNVFSKNEKQITYSEDEILFGYMLYKDELWPIYKDYLLLKNIKAIDKIKNNPRMSKKVDELKKINERIENYGKN